MQGAAQYNLQAAIRFGGGAFLVAWFLLLFSGEIWGLDYLAAAQSVVTLSIASIAGCFLTLIVLNVLGRKGKIFSRPGGYHFLAWGLLLSLGTIGVSFVYSLSWPLFVVACVLVGSCGAVFLSAVILQLARLAPRDMLIACGIIFLAGIFVYSFAFYVPHELTTPILCLLPTIASLFFVFDKTDATAFPFRGQAVSSFAGSEAVDVYTPDRNNYEFEEGHREKAKVLVGWRAVMLFSIFMLFSCVVRGYLPLHMDNEFFSYIRSFAIILMLVAGAIVVIVPVLLPQGFRLSNLYRGILIMGVAFFALFPIFGMDNPVALVLADGYRGLCALIAVTFFACMARQIPFFGFRNVCGGLIFFVACGLIGWLVGTLLHFANFDDDLLRVYSSIQCLIALLAFVLLFRQSDIGYFVDRIPVGQSGSTGDGSGRSSSGGRWRQHVTAIAQEKGLTAREEEVFILLAKGFKAQNISERLSVSYNTTRAHIRNIYQKLDVHSQQEFIDLIEVPAKDAEGFLKEN